MSDLEHYGDGYLPVHIPARDVADLAELVAELVHRMADQRNRLHGPPIPVRFSYDRNGVRLGIAALEDELQELRDEWVLHKRDLVPARSKIRHELLDCAAVAMLILEETGAAQRPGPSRAVTSPHGPQLVASWRCERCDCGSGEVYREPLSGDAGELRQAASDHTALTGHQAQFRRGTCETLYPLATSTEHTERK